MKTDQNYWGCLPEVARPIEHSDPELKIARVSSQNRGLYLLGIRQEEHKARLCGRLRHDTKEAEELPVVGDWVCYREEQGSLQITSVLPRANSISRKISGNSYARQVLAANIQYIAIVMSLDGGRNYQSRALERYLTLAWESGATPLILLNKADLCRDPEPWLAEAAAIAPGVDILLVSAKSGQGLDGLKTRLVNHSATPGSLVLIGPSGTGKTALSNALLEREDLQTNATRAGDLRGRHTTTSARLYPLPFGGQLIDSPGLKELAPMAEEEALESVFEEIASLADDCRFRDCSHQGEPGCAVQQALQEQRLDPVRYSAWLDQLRELRHTMAMADQRSRLKERQRQKQFGKQYKERMAHIKARRTNL